MTNEFAKIFVRGLYKLAGLDSPYSRSAYGANWTKQRQKCLDRDGHQCRVCGTSEHEIGRAPAVHHIKPRIEFEESDWMTYNSLTNLITLCHSCHGTLEGKYTDCAPQEFVEKAKQNNT